ncbi:MAG: DUF5652 family protein [Patescibacteria group bacterium]
MEQFLIQNKGILLLIIIWSSIWKGIALWKATKNNDKKWFSFLFIFNTIGILEILYIYFFSKKTPKTS